MSRRRVYKEETIQVIGRFYDALDMLIASGRIRGIQTYCTAYEIDKRHLYTQREDKNKGFFEIYWVIPLIKDFDVMPNWILFGTGKMFKQRKEEQ